LGSKSGPFVQKTRKFQKIYKMGVPGPRRRNLMIFIYFRPPHGDEILTIFKRHFSINFSATFDQFITHFFPSVLSIILDIILTSIFDQFLVPNFMRYNFSSWHFVCPRSDIFGIIYSEFFWWFVSWFWACILLGCLLLNQESYHLLLVWVVCWELSLSEFLFVWYCRFWYLLFASFFFFYCLCTYFLFRLLLMYAFGIVI
jgi:hypothetical protein